MPGRARLRVPGVRGKPLLATRLANRLSSDGGVHGVRASSVTGSLLVSFDPSRIDVRALMAAGRRHAQSVDERTNGHRASIEAWHQLPASTVMTRLSTPGSRGLSAHEAETRLAQVGANRLPTPEPKSSTEILTGHLTSLPVLLLGGAAALALVSAAPSKRPSS